jgi:hypothetical protein
MAGCGALSAVSGIPGSNHGRQRRKRSQVSAAGSAAVRPQPRGGRGGRTPTARTPPSWNHPRRCVRPPVHSPGCWTPRRTRVRPSAAIADGRCAARVSDTRCPQRGRRTGRCPQAQRPADMTVEAAAEGPQRFSPGGGNGTGCRTPDRSGSHPPWTPRPPAGRRGRTQDRTPEAADGQSADRSGSLQPSLHFLKVGPAGGHLRRPSSRRQRRDGYGRADRALARGCTYTNYFPRINGRS